MDYKLRYFKEDELKGYSEEEQAKYVTTKVTDFMVLTGYREDGRFACFTDEGNCYFPPSSKPSLIYGGIYHEAVCPVLPSTELWNENASEIIELGLYPQWLASREETYRLEEGFRNNELRSTGLSYTFYEWNSGNYNSHIYPVYSSNNQLYIHYTIQRKLMDGSCLFIQDRYFLPGEATWVKVTPVEWLMDRKNSLLVSRYCLVNGIPINDYQRFIRFMSEDMFQLNLIALERLNKHPLRETSLSRDIDYIREQLNLSRGISKEATPFLDRALERLDVVSDKIDTSYQKVKK